MNPDTKEFLQDVETYFRDRGNQEVLDHIPSLFSDTPIRQSHMVEHLDKKSVRLKERRQELVRLIPQLGVASIARITPLKNLVDEVILKYDSMRINSQKHLKHMVTEVSIIASIDARLNLRGDAR